MKLLRDLRIKLRRWKLSNQDPSEIFTDFARRNKWGDKDSLSGKGSNLDATAELRRRLPSILQELEIKIMLDIPCGDFYWMQYVNLQGIRYMGGDIVNDIISKNIKMYRNENISFAKIDIIKDALPQVDLIFVRDCLVHFSLDHAQTALRNIIESKSTWLMATTFPQTSNNINIMTGEWHPINLTKPPFSLPDPTKLFFEGQAHIKGQTPDKALGLWRIDKARGL